MPEVNSVLQAGTVKVFNGDKFNQPMQGASEAKSIAARTPGRGVRNIVLATARTRTMFLVHTVCHDDVAKKYCAISYPQLLRKSNDTATPATWRGWRVAFSISEWTRTPESRRTRHI